LAGCFVVWIVFTLLIGGEIAFIQFWQEHLAAWEAPATIVAFIAGIALMVTAARVRCFQSVFVPLALVAMGMFLVLFGLILAFYQEWQGYMLLLAVIVTIVNFISIARRAALVNRAQKRIDRANAQINAVHRSLGERDVPDQADYHNEST